jgi:hypothetical protein
MQLEFIFFFYDTGLFTGSFVTLFSVYAILAHFSGIFTSTSTSGYVETVYPVFRWVPFGPFLINSII